MNAELSEEKMITQRDPATTDRRARRGGGGRGGEIERARCSLAASAECSYFVLITKTLSGKGGERSRKKRNWHKEKTYRRVTNVLP